MKLPKFIKNLFTTNEHRRQLALLKKYEAGEILQVDNDKDNKKHLLSLENN